VNVKVTWFLRYKQAGYSFSLYLVTPDLSTALPKAKRLAGLYMRLMGEGVEMPFFRVSDVAVTGDSLFLEEGIITVSPGGTVTQPGWAGAKAWLSDAPDFGTTAILVTFVADASSKGRMYMRLIPDGLIAYPSGYTSDPNWDKGFRDLEKEIVTQGWAMKSTASNAVNPVHKINQFTKPLAPDNVTITTHTTHGILAGERLRVGKVQGGSGLNGTWKALTVPTPLSITLEASQGADITGAMNGEVRKLTTGYTAIQSLIIRGVTGRKIGRPFGVPVGRRSV